MATIAKGMITLSSVNDAFTVSLSPSSCVINAKWNGDNPDYSNAYSDMTVYRGETSTPFEILQQNAVSVLNYDVVDLPDNVKRIRILEIDNGVLSGKVSLQVKCAEDFTTWVHLPFTVVRETSMLDWILDWEGREKTEIAGEHIITPKIFVGKSEDGGKLTGTYIGPSFDNSSRVGVFGYSGGKEIFHLDDTGGMIGGWHIEDGGIQTVDGYLKILSEGSIISAPNGTTAWKLLSDGTASFANGNVIFHSNGDADFKGTINSTSGKIGGWEIGKRSIYNNAILIDSNSQFIGIRRVDNNFIVGEPTYESFYRKIRKDGGISIFSQNNISYGIECWVPQTNTIEDDDIDGSLVFSLGYTNMIAGWHFDQQAIYIGNKNNTARQNTTDSGDITIGTLGLRGKNWYIDTDGEISFVGGLLHFTEEGGTIAGWSITPNMFASAHAVLTSDSVNAGLYLSVADFTDKPSSDLPSIVLNNGGFYVRTGSINTQLCAYSKINGSIKQTILFNSNGISRIASWNFNDSSFYCGTENNVAGSFTSTGASITMGSQGLRGYKWRLEATGAGALAGGNIEWTEDGKVTFNENVWLSWDSKTGTGTKVTSEGVFTGSISADNISAGTISSVSIKSDGNWALNADGSGYLAGQNLSWDANGNLSVKGKIEATSGSIAGFGISNGCIGVEAKSSDEVSLSAQESWANLTICKDFFKVGGAKGYVMFGNNVAPGHIGGAFTATGRIVNNAPNSTGPYIFDQANYGLFIDVTGGTKNYGISSNAALKAPAFVNTEVKILTLSSPSNTIDFSQHTVFLLYYNDPNYSYVEVTMPSEQSVARQFGLDKLPENFGTILTFRVRAGSKDIKLKGIYDTNESLSDYTLGSGDSIQILISNIDGFRYQILNHSF